MEEQHFPYPNPRYIECQRKCSVSSVRCTSTDLPRCCGRADAAKHASISKQLQALAEQLHACSHKYSTIGPVTADQDGQSAFTGEDSHPERDPVVESGLHRLTDRVSVRTNVTLFVLTVRETATAGACRKRREPQREGKTSITWPLQAPQPPKQMSTKHTYLPARSARQSRFRISEQTVRYDCLDIPQQPRSSLRAFR